MALLTAAGERPSRRLAPARLPSSSVATNTFIASIRSMLYRPEFVGNATRYRSLQRRAGEYAVMPVITEPGGGKQESGQRVCGQSARKGSGTGHSTPARLTWQTMDGARHRTRPIPPG